jgi:hypothetical protein
MKKSIRVAAAIFLGAGLIAAGSGGAALASSATSSHYVVLDCNLKPEVAPSTLVITCADNGLGVQGLHWTTWTSKLASGYGTVWENDCKPDCAEGHIHYYPSLEMLWGSAPVQGHPADRRYTKLTVIFTGKNRPPVYVLKNGHVVATYPVTHTFDIY